MQTVATKREIETDGLGERVARAARIRAGAAAAARVEAPVYLVGGAVRDALLGAADRRTSTSWSTATRCR